MPSISPKVTPYYGGGQVLNPVDTLKTSGVPSTANIHHALGTLAVDNAASEIYALVSKSGGHANWALLGGVGGYPITPFVVGPSGSAGYKTVQSAVNAATAAGGGIIYIQPGTYTENLTIGPNIHLVALLGTSGNDWITSSGNLNPAVEIIGNCTFDFTQAVVTPNTILKNILFSSTSGNVITANGTIALFNSGFLTFEGCWLETATGSSAIFNTNGYFYVNLISCIVTEQTANTTNFLSFGAIPFINIAFRDSYININGVNPCVLPNSSFITFYLENTAYSAMMDLSSGSSSFFLKATNSAFSFNGSTPGTPLINYGANDGFFTAQNCIVTQASGSFGNSTTFDANSYFQYTSCVFNVPLVMGSTGRGDFRYCQFFGGTSAAVTMSSAEAVSFIGCVFSSTNNPCIAGSGAGTITLGDVTFVNNSSIAGTLTLAWAPTKSGPMTTTGNLFLAAAGNKLSITTGSNASVGQSGSMTAGSITISTTAVTASSLIFLTNASVGGTVGTLSVGTITAGTSFVINSSSNTDTSKVNWWIIN